MYTLIKGELVERNKWCLRFLFQAPPDSSMFIDKVLFSGPQLDQMIVELWLCDRRICVAPEHMFAKEGWNIRVPEHFDGFISYIGQPIEDKREQLLDEMRCFLYWSVGPKVFN